MNELFNYEINNVLKNAEKEMLDLNHPYVGSEHLLLALLKEESIKPICQKNQLDYESFKQELISIVGLSSHKSEVVLYTPLLRIILDDATLIAKREKQNLSPKILFRSLLTNDDGIALRILMSMNIEIDAIYSSLIAKTNKVLDNIGINLNQKEDTFLVGREKEITSLLEILLRKNKNNPILIGEAGVGKSAIVYELAKRIESGNVPKMLKNTKIISVDMASMLANTKYRGEFETKLNNIVDYLKENKNIILFIDEIHTIVKSGGGDGSIDAGNILKPYLATNEIKIIGATTINEYEKFIAPDKALSRRFAKVLIKEPDKVETVNILKGVKKHYEKYHNVLIPNKICETIVELADAYLINSHYPDKALEVLDNVCSKTNIKTLNNKNDDVLNKYLKEKKYKEALLIRKKENRKPTISKKDCLRVIEEMTGVHLITPQILKKLKTHLEKNIYGQDLNLLNSYLKKLTFNNLVSFEINGYEGVGKSYTCKLIADFLNYNLLEIDFKEYNYPTSINRLIGSDPGYIGYKDAALLDEIKHHPYTLIHLKNYELSPINIKNLFSSIIKNNKLKMKNGDTINFNNTLIIMTSTNNTKKVGYNNESLNNENIYYNLIDKKILTEYIVDNKLDKNIIENLKEKDTFKHLKEIEDYLIYKTDFSMV